MPIAIAWRSVRPSGSGTSQSALHPRLLGIAAPVRLADPPAGQHHRVAGPVARVRRRLDPAGEVDAGNVRILAHQPGARAEAEAVLVVERSNSRPRPSPRRRAGRRARSRAPPPASGPRRPARRRPPGSPSRRPPARRAQARRGAGACQTRNWRAGARQAASRCVLDLDAHPRAGSPAPARSGRPGTRVATTTVRRHVAIPRRPAAGRVGDAEEPAAGGVAGQRRRPPPPGGSRATPRERRSPRSRSAARSALAWSLKSAVRVWVDMASSVAGKPDQPRRRRCWFPPAAPC